MSAVVQIAQIQSKLAELDNIEARATLTATQQQLIQILHQVRNTDDVDAQRKQLEQQLESTIQQHLEQHRADAARALEDSVLNAETVEVDDLFNSQTHAAPTPTTNVTTAAVSVKDTALVNTSSFTAAANGAATPSAAAPTTAAVPPTRSVGTATTTATTSNTQSNATILHQYKAAKPTALYTDHRDQVKNYVELSQQQYKQANTKPTLSAHDKAAVDNVLNIQNHQQVFFLSDDTRTNVLNYIKQHKAQQQLHTAPHAASAERAADPLADPLEQRKQAIRRLRMQQMIYKATYTTLVVR